MKKLLICLLLPLCMGGCKSYMGETQEAFYDNLGYDLYRYVELYYCEHLDYPSKDQLYDFCWEIVNSANGHAFETYDAYMEKEGMNQVYDTGAEPLLHFLHTNSSHLLFKRNGKDLRISWDGKARQKIKLNCRDIINSRRRHNLFCMYDSLGNVRRVNSDEEDIFFSLREKVRTKHYQIPEEAIAWEWVLLRYDRNLGYQSFYPSSLRVEKIPYLKSLGEALDTFLLNRNKQMIQFVTAVPKKEKYRKR